MVRKRDKERELQSRLADFERRLRAEAGAGSHEEVTVAAGR
jgi:hypothetical protein